MKKLLILLFSILISFNSYGEELNSLFGITLYDNAEKHISSNYIDSNKTKNRETIDGYFDLLITDEIKTKSPYASFYLIVIDNDNKVHSIYGFDHITNIDTCLESQKDLSSTLEKKYQIDFDYWENTYPTFKIYSNFYNTSSYNKYAIQCNESYSEGLIYFQIYINSSNLRKAIEEFYDAGL
jgi:hypothetical protein